MRCLPSAENGALCHCLGLPVLLIAVVLVAGGKAIACVEPLKFFVIE